MKPHSKQKYNEIYFHRVFLNFNMENIKQKFSILFNTIGNYWTNLWGLSFIVNELVIEKYKIIIYIQVEIKTVHKLFLDIYMVIDNI